MDTDVFQKDVEEEYSLRPPTATKILKDMEKNGLIRRETVPYDSEIKADRCDGKGTPVPGNDPGESGGDGTKADRGDHGG